MVATVVLLFFLRCVVQDAWEARVQAATAGELEETLR